MDTYFSIVSDLNGMVLDITGGTPAKGIQVTMFPSNGADHQLWYHDINTGAVHSKKDRNYVLDIENNLLVVNRHVKDRNTQRFGLGPKYIYLLTDKYQVLDVEKSNPEKMANVILFACNGGINQSWKYKSA